MDSGHRWLLKESFLAWPLLEASFQKGKSVRAHFWQASAGSEHEGRVSSSQRFATEVVSKYGRRLVEALVEGERDSDV